MSDIPTASGNRQDWRYLGHQIRRRTLEPSTSFPFLVYVLIGIVLFGGLGVWAEVLRLVLAQGKPELAGLITAVITFFPALIGSTTLQLVLMSTSSNDKVMISFALLLLCSFITAAILLPFFSTTHPITVLLLGGVCSLAAIWTWWMTNGLDSTFHSQRSDAATGGDTGRTLQGADPAFKV
ncbi:MAG: hypothetical protein LCH78_19835 [Proteobacteria bacterium]|nr:hypothetical protein [Pseudomonadota bacterium]